VAVPVATGLALGSVHLGRLGRAVGTLALVPLAVSAVTVAFGIVLAFDSPPLQWRDDKWMLPVVHAMVALPLVHRVVSPAIAAVRPGQREAARVLGASPVRALVDVDLAQSGRAVAAGAGLAAAVSIGEFGASTLLARSESATVPVMLGRLAGRVGDVPQQASQAIAALMGIVVVGMMARA
jgi:thiamine transport system permease protein